MPVLRVFQVFIDKVLGLSGGVKLERRSPLTIALALTAIAALYAGYWFFIAHQLTQGYAALQSEQAKNRVAIASRALTHEGFPARVVLKLDAPAVQKSGAPELAYTADGVTVALSPFEPTRGTLETTGGPQHLAFHDPRQGLSLDATSTHAKGKLAFRGLAGALDYAQLWIDGLAGSARLSADTGPAAFAAARVEAILRPGRYAQNGTPQKETVFALIGEDVTLPEAAGRLLGTKLAYTMIDAQLTGGKGGPFNVDTLNRDGVRALRTFFEGDGRLDMTRLALRWGALDAVAHGSLKLDALHRPEGSLMIEVAGYRELLAALSRENILKEGMANAIGSALDVLAAMRRDPMGRAAVVLICQKGKLFVGPVEVATLKPLF